LLLFQFLELECMKSKRLVKEIRTSGVAVNVISTNEVSYHDFRNYCIKEKVICNIGVTRLTWTFCSATAGNLVLTLFFSFFSLPSPPPPKKKKIKSLKLSIPFLCCISCSYTYVK